LHISNPLDVRQSIKQLNTLQDDWQQLHLQFPSTTSFYPFWFGNNHSTLSFSYWRKQIDDSGGNSTLFSANLNFSGKTESNAQMKLYHVPLEDRPVYFKTLTNGKNFSPSFGGRTSFNSVSQF
jgi:hypothetical protein